MSREQIRNVEWKFCLYSELPLLCIRCSFLKCSTEDVSKDEDEKESKEDEKESKEEKKAEPTPMVSYKDLVRNIFTYYIENLVGIFSVGIFWNVYVFHRMSFYEYVVWYHRKSSNNCLTLENQLVCVYVDI